MELNTRTANEPAARFITSREQGPPQRLGNPAAALALHQTLGTRRKPSVFADQLNPARQQ